MNESIFVAFEPRDTGFIASVPMEQFDYLGPNPEESLREASEMYQRSVQNMRTLLSDMDELKAKRTPISARSIWDLGDEVLTLVDELSQRSMELDGLYEQLGRDLGMNG